MPLTSRATSNMARLDRSDISSDTISHSLRAVDRTLAPGKTDFLQSTFRLAQQDLQLFHFSFVILLLGFPLRS